MENIRSDNQELRQWGNDEYDRAEEAEEERDNAVYKCDQLEDKIDILESEIDYLKDEISNLNLI